MAPTPTHEAQRDPLKGRIVDIIIRDIEAQGPIFRAMFRQFDLELSRYGQTLKNHSGFDCRDPF